MQNVNAELAHEENCEEPKQSYGGPD
jgi:hypothetical protein